MAIVFRGGHCPPFDFWCFGFLLAFVRLEWAALAVEKNWKYLRILPAALLILTAAVFSAGQQSSGNKQNVRPETTPAATPPPATGAEKKPATFIYEFTQPEFYVRHIVIEHDVNGLGRINFERLNEGTAFEEPLQLSAAALARISKLWDQLGFLNSNESYQADKQFPHLGTMRLTMESEAQKRTAEFNWTHNKDAASLIDEYRRIADQAILIFDIEVARENQPLNGPKLMEQLERMLKRNGLSDPKQLVPLLKEITSDEHLPLMARNHAGRLLKQIQK